MASKEQDFLADIGINVDLKDTNEEESPKREALNEADDDLGLALDDQGDVTFDDKDLKVKEADISEEDFYKYYSLLDKSNMVEEDDESTLIADEGRSIQFVSDKYLITLLDNNEDCKITIKSFN